MSAPIESPEQFAARNKIMEATMAAYKIGKGLTTEEAQEIVNDASAGKEYLTPDRWEKFKTIVQNAGLTVRE